MLGEIGDYWRVYPPMHEVVVKYLGAGEELATEATVEDVARAFGLPLPP
jgi:hypothetical protein